MKNHVTNMKYICYILYISYYWIMIIRWQPWGIPSPLCPVQAVLSFGALYYWCSCWTLDAYFSVETAHKGIINSRMNLRTGRLRHSNIYICVITHNVVEAMVSANQVVHVTSSRKDYFAAGAEKGVLAIGITIFCDHTQT